MPAGHVQELLLLSTGSCSVVTTAPHASLHALPSNRAAPCRPGASWARCSRQGLLSLAAVCLVGSIGLQDLVT